MINLKKISLWLTFLSLVVLSFLTLDSTAVLASTNNFVSIVNPVRGDDFWNLKNQKPIDAMIGEHNIASNLELPVTWLVRFDALKNPSLVDFLKSLNNRDELGLFLEVTPTWTKNSGVNYNQGSDWNSAQSVFLTGYSVDDRKKLIDRAFGVFKDQFGYYPKSVGAWWIDGQSLNYMYQKYNITTALIVSDQYSTDSYQIWGQYWSTPYYPYKDNVLIPARASDEKTPVVMMQWAARDPINGYGKGVENSTYSVQPNDYTDYHHLDISYFNKLLKIYLFNQFNQFGDLVIGLENSYDWSKYYSEYNNQLQTVANIQKQGTLKVVTMGEFASWYGNAFTTVSPDQIIIAKDPLGTNKTAVWYMNPYYRVGWFYDGQKSAVLDLRQYINGEEELCRDNPCNSLNFATFATRVLDYVTYGELWQIDKGKIYDFNISKAEDGYNVSYVNEGGMKRQIGFLQRDIKIDDKTYTIDGAILTAKGIKPPTIQDRKRTWNFYGDILISVGQIVKELGLFILFILLVFFSPGFLIIDNFFPQTKKLLNNVFLSISVGMVLFSLVSFLPGYFTLKLPLLYSYLWVSLAFLIRKIYYFRRLPKIINFDLNLIILGLIIIIGTIFQIIPVVKSGLLFDFGIGFWGPNTHDGVWHLSLINQLIQNIPPQNPIFSGDILTNYHYLYDLLIASTYKLIPVNLAHLVFRFFPLLFSSMLGIGTIIFCQRFTRLLLPKIFCLFFVYFSGSFGWIVEYIHQRHLGGESAFWANQAASFNLNPPFAVSLIILISGFILISQRKKFALPQVLIISVIFGCLIGFKAYAGILALGSLFIVGGLLLILESDFTYLFIFFISAVVSLLLALPVFGSKIGSLGSGSIFIFSPFWFIHSMIDSLDRVGWFRLSLTRNTALEKGQLLKLFGAEGLGLVIFIFGNLGTRFLSLGLFYNLKTMLGDRYILLLTVFSLLSLLIPIFFIQSGNPWNTIQFIYYLLFITSIGAGLILFKVSQKLPLLLGIFIVFFILVITPINSVATVLGYTGSSPHAYISNQEIDALSFLQFQPTGVVLTVPYDNRLKRQFFEPYPLYVYDTTAYVSAYGQKPVYIDDEIQQVILGTDYNKRLALANEFFQDGSKDWAENFLTSNNISYIYIPTAYGLNLERYNQIMENIYHNEEVDIYKLKIR